MKVLSTLLVLFTLVACSGPKNYYQLSDFMTLQAYQKENKELYLELSHGDSFSWIANTEVTVKESEIILRVPYTLNETETNFMRNKHGHLIQKILTKDKLKGKKILYSDDSGMHEIELKEFKEELLDPYVAPELSDPFETQKTERETTTNSTPTHSRTD